MTDQKVGAKLMKMADELFWDEFNQVERAGDRYMVIDSKNQTVVGQNLRLIRDKKKVLV